MVKTALVCIGFLAACSVEEPAKTSTTSSQLTYLGTPMFARITAAQNPNQPPGKLRGRIHSIATFDSAFQYGGVTYPYTMVGTAPEVGGTTIVPTQIVPTRFVFADGTVLDGTGSVPGAVGSPVFASSPYSVGTTQFTDAVQRATFWSRMKPNYHVQISAHPVVRPTVDIVVPADKSLVIPVSPTSSVALVDIDWFYNFVRTNLSPSWSVTTFPIVLSHNVFFYIGDPSQCCVLGFHDAYLTGINPAFNLFDAQTWAWASYSDPGLFGAPISDVHALSHEVAEWMNDPFGFNIVPPWQGNDAYGCSPVLEVGDPLVGAAYPITMPNGTTYYPQTQALLPWFARESPSSAIDHAYSYPGENALTSLPRDCSF